MERVLKAIYGQVRSGKDYRSYVDLKDFCREVMKTDIPLAIKYAKYLEGKMTRRDVWNSLQSWRSHAERFSAHNTINNMEILYV